MFYSLRKFHCLLAIPVFICTGSLQAAPDLSALPRTESPNLKKVKPPQDPKVFNEHRPEAEIDRLPLPEQPKELTAALLDLEQGSIEERIAKVKHKAIADLVYVRGGSFLRGDFSKKQGEDRFDFTPNLDDKFLKEITLSDFWIGKYKVAYAEFDVFTDATKRPRTGMEYDGDGRHPLLPAGAYWPEAKAYCQWLGEITGYPFDLPTEAQWEYAARSRGQFFATATDDGNWDKDRNAPSTRLADNIVKKYVNNGFRYPIGLFPPNPLGLHDMAFLTWEWVNDWYAEDAYEKAESRDPQGPASGEKKVYRSWHPANGQILGTSIWRKSEKPIPDGDVIGGEYMPHPTSYSPTLRCVVNSIAKQP